MSFPHFRLLCTGTKCSLPTLTQPEYSTSVFEYPSVLMLDVSLICLANFAQFCAQRHKGTLENEAEASMKILGVKKKENSQLLIMD